jgi:ABC-2 type transport system permease protein
MKYFTKRLRIYLPFTRSIIQIMMTYRLNFYFFVFGSVLKTFVIYYLWQAVFTNSSSAVLNGFTASDMLIYIFMSSITAGTISNRIDQVIGSEVKDGSIAMNLIKPINYHLRLLFESFGELLYGTLCVSLPLYLALIAFRFFSIGELPPNFSIIGPYILSVIFGFSIMFLFNFCFGLLAFYVTNTWGIGQLKHVIINFISGQMVPLVFFPVWLQNGLVFLPFSSINYIPVMIYLNKINGTALIKAFAVQVFWVIFLLLFSIWLWKKATKRLTILGG